MKKFAIVAVCLAVGIMGCATPRMTQVPETMALKAPPQVTPPLTKPEPQKAEELPPAKDRNKFSLSVRDADLRDVFLLLSKDSGINIIADKEVAGKISIDFTNLELNSALYAITRPLGYTFRMDKGFIRITKPILETKTFRVNYITGKRTSTSTMNAAISTGNSSSGSSGGGTNINISSGAPSSSSGASSSSSSQGTVNVTTSGTSDFWKEIRRGLDVLVFGDSRGGGDSEGGFSRGDEKTGKKLVISEIAGIVLVTDYSDSMERIEDFLKDVELAARKQVMIQAHIVEVALNDGFQYGIDWNTLLQLPGNIDISLKQNFRPSVPGLDRDAGLFTMQFGHAKDYDILEAMKTQGQVNVLSSPKVSTMNNQRAVIKLTTKEVSWVTTSYTSGTTGDVVVSNTIPQIDEIGLFLDVTPQIDDYGVITMQIHPSISENKGTSKSGNNSKPIIDTREVDTMIKTRNGQTIVIAGLITDKITDTTKSVPLLSDIPIIGAAFRQVVQDKKKSELVILLTPYVLTDQSIEDIRREHEERFRKAGRTFEASPVLPFNGK